MTIDNDKLTSLVKQYQSGDAEAFAEIYQMTYEFARFNALKRMNNNVADAEDLVQDTYIKAMNKLETLKKPETFLGWFKMILWNTGNDQIKRESKHFSADDEWVYDKRASKEAFKGKTPESDIESAEFFIAIDQLINEFPDNRRMMLTMSLYDEMSDKEIAQALNKSVTNVKSTLSRAKAQLALKVKALQNQTGKLLGFAPLPLVTLALRYASKISAAEAIANGSSERIYHAVTSAAGVTAAAATAAGAAAGSGGLFAKIASLFSVKKAAAGAATIAVIAGTTGALYMTDRLPLPKVPDTITSIAPSDQAHQLSETMRWEITDDHVLIIDGNGEMNSWYRHPETTPWADEVDSVETIVVKDGVENIGGMAFQTLGKANTIYLPKSIKKIEPGILAESKKQKVIYNGNCQDFFQIDTMIGTSYFLKCVQCLDGYCGIDGWMLDTNGTLTIKDYFDLKNPNYIGDWSPPNYAPWYELSQYIQKIEIDSSIEAIESFAFLGCVNAVSISLPNTIQYIGRAAFVDCGSLREISIPSSVKYIGSSAFPQKGISIHYDGYLKDWKKIILEDKKDHWVSNVRVHLTPSVDIRASLPKLTKNQQENKTIRFIQTAKNNQNAFAGEIHFDGSCADWIRSDSSNLLECVAVCADGVCGNSYDVFWIIKNNTLRLFGDGYMRDSFDINSALAPWAPYMDQVKVIQIEDGVRNLASDFLRACYQDPFMNVTKRSTIELQILLPKSLRTIGNNALCAPEFVDLATVDVPKSVVNFGRDVCYPETDIVFLGTKKQFDKAHIIKDNSEFFEESLMWYNRIVFHKRTMHQKAQHMIQFVLSALHISYLTDEQYQDVLNESYTYDENGILRIHCQDMSSWYRRKNNNWNDFAENVYILNIKEPTNEIADHAFESLNNVQLINISSSVKRIGDHAFGDCSQLDTIVFHGSENEWNQVVVGKQNETWLNKLVFESQ